jgi:26S proteasome regulatory subunit N9
MDVDTATGSSSWSSFLDSLLNKLPPSLHEQVHQLDNQAQRKLWHQLTNTLQSFLSNPETNGIQIELYDKFVNGLSGKLDKRRLVEIATTVAGQYEGGSFSHLDMLLVPSRL